MKRFSLIILVLILSTAKSSSQLSFGGGAHFGLAIAGGSKFEIPMPVGNAKQTIDGLYGASFAFGGHGTLNINKQVGVRLSIDYTNFSASQDKFDKLKQPYSDSYANQVNFPAADVRIEGLSATMIGIDAAGIWKFEGIPSLRPYGLFGLGFTAVSYKDLRFTVQGFTGEDIAKVNSQTKFHFSGGGGVEFPVARIVRLYVELKYVVFLAREGTVGYIPILVGATFGG
jgi:opacity protein-like surface antigen